ncbi:pentapeptide repeat protein [Nocardiopsis sp. Huas11]|uniref:pentapeptide repeat-containing protein n=1 Tax=Nocardiopsis sp. Huas11 TaxID=2183912 RepID=UPI000EAD5342|nr:pentapeptide repeat-containing protein [Nocardiopsis sp. Huas11]RKS09144.1 pentapeptide repeat protein [Nocardiopsis sp. Huas11]
MRSPTPRQRIGIALATVALPALTATAWPLFVFLWGLLPEALPLGRILLGVTLIVALAVAAVLIRAEVRRRTSFRLWWLIIAAWAVAISAVAAMVLLIWLVLGLPGLDSPSELSPRAMDAIATRSFAVVAGLGGVALLVIHYRRQRTTEADAERAERAAARDVTKLFNERFTTAYTELGSEHAAVRLGAVHALAHLADDAPLEEEAQMVIDVLCAYLRMPSTPRPEELPKNASKARREEHRERELEFASLREVRHTIIRIIGNHLRADTRWRGKDYDFTGVVFDGGALHSIVFSGGEVSFTDARFCGDLVDLGDVEFSGGEVDFSRARFSSDYTNFYGARFSGSQVYFNDAEFTGDRVDFAAAGFFDGSVSFDRATFSGGEVSFPGAEFAGANVSFTDAKFTARHVYFSWAEFTDGEVDFAGAEFTAGEVDFDAEFKGGDVSFVRGRFGEGEDAVGACPTGLLEAVESGPGAVALPEVWRPSGNQEDQPTPSHQSKHVL